MIEKYMMYYFRHPFGCPTILIFAYQCSSFMRPSSPYSTPQLIVCRMKIASASLSRYCPQLCPACFYGFPQKADHVPRASFIYFSYHLKD